MFPIIAIDGPAASGKSSVAKKIAHQLGITFVSSGELYRTATWAAVQASMRHDSEEAIKEFFLGIRISSQEQAGKIVFLINNRDVSEHLNDVEVNQNVSLFARSPRFRIALLRPLRDLANSFPLVMEGRDIGSVVFPATPYKFYLDASEEERQRRRSQQGIIDSIVNRDQLDSTRKIAPLIVPNGAFVVDTTMLSLNEVVEKIVEEIKNKRFPFIAKCE